MHGLTKQAAQRRLKTEFSNRKQRLHPGFPRIRIGEPVDPQPVPLDVNAICHPDVKLPEFNPAFETSR